MHNHSHHHHHHHGHSHSEQQGLIKNLWLVLLLNFSFTIIEFFGGYFTDSIAIISDAFHDLGDSLAILGAIILERIAQKASNARYTYGYQRFSILSALAISLVLIAGSVYVLFQAIPRLSESHEVNSLGMLWLAVLGLGVNGAAAFRLFKSGNSVNQRAIMLHLLEDTLGWAAVLIGAVVIYYTGLSIIDPILSLVIALYILLNAFKSLRKAMGIMLQRAPSGIDREAVKQKIEALEMVQDVHDLHIWSLDGEKNIATLHIRLNNNYLLEVQSELKKEIRHILEHLGLQHVTIEFDTKEGDCQFDDC